MTAPIAALIPTRDRAELAIEAVRSLIDQDCAIDIYVSDNSASPEPLRSYCSRETRATYLRPPRVLAMPDHWDWALRQVLERSAATHVSVHYDRKFSKPRRWGRLAAIASRRPDALVTYSVDHISHWPPPLRIWQAPWTGKLFEIDTAAAAAEIAAGRVNATGHALPILSNCIVPRGVLEAVRARFGDICNSTGPDSAFMSRFLASAGSYLHYDDAIGIVYASHRSNGMGYLRGEGGDFADFRTTFGDRPWLDAAPLPGASLGQNMLYHEYELVRRATGERLPPLDRAAVIEDLAAALVWVADPDAKAVLSDHLRRQGWSGEEPAPMPRHGWRARLYQMQCERRMRRGGEAPPNICGFAYRSEREALAAGLGCPRRPEEKAEHLATLSAVEVVS